MIKKIITIQILVILAAFLTSFSAPPINFFPLAWFTFIPILFVMKSIKSNKVALFLGLEMGLIINLHAFYWLNHTIVIFGHLHWAIALILYILLSFLQGIRYGVFFYLYKRFDLEYKNIFIFALLYASLEFFFPMLFNWTLGNTQYLFLPFIQIVDIFGISFLSFVMALFNIILFKMILFGFVGRTHENKGRTQRFAPTHMKPLGFFMIFFSIVIIYGVIQINRYDKIMKNADKIKIGVVQANIDIFDIHDPQKYQDNIMKFKTESLLARDEGAELIIWPESSSYSSTKYDATKMNVAPYLKTPLILGGLSYKRTKDDWWNYNTAFFIDEEQNILNTYHKHYLLAFGEYMPFGEYFPKWKQYFRAVGNFKPGEEIRIFNFKNKAKIGVLICYEDIIEMFSNKVNKKEPNILINMSNDAWFGNTAAPDLHRMIAQYRTVENRKPLVRVTNTGRTIFIDAVGRLGKTLPIYTTGHIVDDVPIMKGKTLYQLFGWSMPYLYILFIIIIFIYEKRKKA
jgi:apolipoprotein N-acyltransferase